MVNKCDSNQMQSRIKFIKSKVGAFRETREFKSRKDRMPHIRGYANR